jgi:tetratricopeptide (TPR) repeat protein
VTTLKHLRIFSGGKGGKPRGAEKDPLDQFLTDVADPGLMHSLRQEEHRRRFWLFAVAALVLGLLVGGGAVWWLRGSLKEGQGADRAAAATGKLGAQSSEEMARILTTNGLALAKAKEILKAWAYLRLATELSPNMVEAWDALAVAHFYGGQMDEAERAFRRCTEIDPAYQRGYHGMGDVYFYTGNNKKAEEYWLKGEAIRGVARLRLLQGRFAEAAPLVQDLERTTPDQWFVRLMAEAVRTGRLTAELRLQLEPGFVGSRSPETAQGWRLYFAHRYNEGSAAFGRALAGNPRDGSALLGQGWCRLKTGKPQEARVDFDQVLKTWPSNYSALNGLGWSLKAQGRTEAAAAAWKRVLELRPESPETPESLKGLGLLAFERGDFAQAGRYLTRSLLQNPYDPETKTFLEDALEKLPDGQEGAQSSMLRTVKP